MDFILSLLYHRVVIIHSQDVPVKEIPPSIPTYGA